VKFGEKAKTRKSNDSKCQFKIDTIIKLGSSKLTNSVETVG